MIVIHTYFLFFLSWRDVERAASQQLVGRVERGFRELDAPDRGDDAADLDRVDDRIRVRGVDHVLEDAPQGREKRMNDIREGYKKLFHK